MSAVQPASRGQMLRRALALAIAAMATGIVASSYVSHQRLKTATAQLTGVEVPAPEVVAELLAEAHHHLVMSAVAAAALMLTAFRIMVLLGRTEHEQREAAKRHEVKATKKFESTIKRTKREHMETLGQMSAVLAHEIRNPLASLKGHAQLLREKIEREPKLERKATRVVDEAVRLENLTNTLLDFARASSVERQEVDPAALLSRAACAVSDDLIVVDAEQAPESWSLDPLRMEQVLINLLQNAMQAGGEAKVDALLRQVDGQLELTVRDRGAGLEGADPAELFAAFHTTKVNGTGLGLTVVKRIVDLHGGRIEAHDHPDGGAVFRVTVPPSRGAA